MSKWEDRIQNSATYINAHYGHKGNSQGYCGIK